MLTDLHRFKRMAIDCRIQKRAGGSSARAVPADFAVRKDFFSPAATLVDDRCLRFTISTPAVDRAMDTIDQAGWDLDAYRRNPVVLWSHDSWSLPIGRCIDIGLDGGNLCATVEFVPADMPEVGDRAEAIFRMARDRYLSATSVGFRPLEYDVTDDPARDDGGWFPGFDFKRQELTEFSICTVPCNPETLIDPAHRQDPANPAAQLLEPVSASHAASHAKALRRLRLASRLALV